MNRLYVSMLLLGLLAAGPASSALADRSGLSEKDQAAMMADMIEGLKKKPQFVSCPS